MAEEFEFYKDLQDETPAKVENRETKSRLQKRYSGRTKALLAASVVLVLLVVLAAAYRGGTGFDVLHRKLTSSSLRDNGDGTRGSYSFDNERESVFAPLGDSLLVATKSSVRVLDGLGNTVYKTNIHFENPAVTVGGSMAAVYDLGGRSLQWFDAAGELGKIDCEGILSAQMNADGWLAVTDQCSGYKGAVSVYNPRQERAFTFYSSERFVTDSIVTPDHKHVAVVTVGEDEGSFVSNVVIYALDSTEAEAELSLRDAFVTCIGAVSGRFALAADCALYTADASGNLHGTYQYPTMYLRGCDFGGDGYVTLLLGRYKSGSLATLVTLNARGEVIGTLEIDEEVLDISAAGKYVALLYSDRLAVYTHELELYEEKTTEQGRHVYLRSDGTALVLSSTSGAVIVP